MNTQTETTLGSFTYFSTLNHAEQALVREAWNVAEKAYTPRSNFPVGAAILAQNDHGETRLLSGCNVENRFFGATICAERNAATTAVGQGYSHFLSVALVLKHYHGPGSSPCGLCRQALTEFGTDTVVLQVADQDSNVLRYTVADFSSVFELLPDSFGPHALL